MLGKSLLIFLKNRRLHGRTHQVLCFNIGLGEFCHVADEIIFVCFLNDLSSLLTRGVRFSDFLSEIPSHLERWARITI